MTDSMYDTAIEHLRNLQDFAYKNGYHEPGYNAVDEVMKEVSYLEQLCEDAGDLFEEATIPKEAMGEQVLNMLHKLWSVLYRNKHD